MKEGALFRQLRTDRGLSLQKVSDEMNSLSFISKFEKGESNISLNRLERLLENINMTMEEFLYLRSLNQQDKLQSIQTYMTSPFFLMLDKILYADSKEEDWKKIDNLRQTYENYQQILTELEQYHGKWKEFLVIYTEILMEIGQINMTHLENPSNEQVSAIVEGLFEKLYQKTRPIIRYLYQVENWSVFEVLLFRLMQFAIPVETVRRLLPIAVSRTEKEKQLPIMRETRTRLLFSSFTVFLNFRKISWAQEVLVMLEEKLKDEDNLSDSTQLLFFKGWYEIIAGEHERGLKKCHQAISIYRILNQPGQVWNYQEHLKVILNNKDRPNDSMIFM